MRKQKVVIIVFIIVLLVIFLAGIFVGVSIESNKIKKSLAISTNDIEAENRITTYTFYATILEVNKHKTVNGNPEILVEGLPINDVNDRGKYSLIVNNETILSWRGTEIDISELDEGDTISVTYADKYLQLISPTTIYDVIWINLLDDEK